jgi:hypothetical protein
MRFIDSAEARIIATAADGHFTMGVADSGPESQPAAR